VIHDGCDDLLDIVGSYKGSTADGRHRLAASEQRDRCSGTASESEVFVVPSLVNDLKQVVPDTWVDVNGSNRLLRRDQLFGGSNGGHRINWMFELQQIKHSQFFFDRWVTQREPHQETIELCFRKRERAFVIDRVLCCNDQERRIERVGFSVDGDASFRHRFEQRCLCSWRCPVDFVGEQNLGEDRTGAEFKFRILLVEDRCAGDIGGQQVGGALDSFEVASEAFREGSGEHRFRHTGDVFEKNVSAAEPGDHRKDQLLSLSYDRIFDVADDAFG